LTNSPKKKKPKRTRENPQTEDERFKKQKTLSQRFGKKNKRKMKKEKAPFEVEN